MRRLSPYILIALLAAVLGHYVPAAFKPTPPPPKPPLDWSGPVTLMRQDRPADAPAPPALTPVRVVIDGQATGYDVPRDGDIWKLTLAGGRVEVWAVATRP